MKILLTNCTRNAGLVVLHALAGRGHEIIAADDRLLPFGLRSRYATSTECLPHELADDFPDALFSLVQRHRPDVVLPFMGGFAISRQRERFERETHVLVPPIEAYAAVNDKQCLLEYCAAVGVAHPRLLDLNSAESALASASVPAVVIKPKENLGGGLGVFVVREVEKLREVYRLVAEKHGDPTVSEYIPGPDSDNFALHLLLDRDSRAVCAFAYQKMRLSPLGTGLTAAGISRRAPDLVRLVLPMLQQLLWVGPADLEFKRDSRDGEWKLIEINPRFSGAVAFPIGCGVNLPDLTCRAAMGEQLPEATAFDYAEGIRYWNPPHYARSVTQELRECRAPLELLRDVRRELGGTRVGNPYVWRDPAPVLGKVLFSLGLRERQNKGT